MTAGAPAAQAVAARAVRGLAWKAASQVVFQVSRIAVAVVLARLLAPHDYGLAGMVLAFSWFVLAFSDLSLGAALVQRRSISELDRSTVFWTSLAAGTAFTLLGVALSWPLATFYGEPEVQPLFVVVSFSFVITSLGVTQAALLMREMDFRRLELRMMAATAAGAVVGISAAARGFGPWAIIAMQLVIAAVSTLLLWRFCPWRPRLVFSLASLRDLGSFGGNVFGQRALYYATRTADAALIGRFLGPAAVGAYALAYNVVLVPATRIGIPIQEVLFPAFSRMQDDREWVAAMWLRVTRLVASISMPLMLCLIVTAPDFVAVVLGAKWSAATPVVQILAWVGVLHAVQTLNGDILQALDRAGTQLRFTALWAAATIGAFAVGLRWGIVGVAACFAATSTVLAPVSTWLTARGVGIDVRTFARGLAGVATAATVAATCVLGARLLLVAAGTPAAARLVILAALGAAVLVPLYALLAPQVLDELRGMRARLRGSSSRSATDQVAPASAT
jgi:O-antigen/teichoic acid export membrane protein